MTTESMPEDDVRMDMRTLLGAIFSRWLRIIAVTLILVAIAYAVLMFVPKVYESQSSILVEPRQNAFTQPTSAFANKTFAQSIALLNGSAGGTWLDVPTGQGLTEVNFWAPSGRAFLCTFEPLALIHFSIVTQVKRGMQRAEPVARRTRRGCGWRFPREVWEHIIGFCGIESVEQIVLKHLHRPYEPCDARNWCSNLMPAGETRVNLELL